MAGGKVDNLKLIDAICEAFDANFMPTAEATFCNLSVQYVLGRFGYDKMRGMDADQMVDYMSRSSDFSPVTDMAQAQALANGGSVVIAGYQNVPHGHVVVLRPGVMEFSGKWNCLTPKCSNVGLRPVGQLGKGLSLAFQDVPKIWVLNLPEEA